MERQPGVERRQTGLLAALTRATARHPWRTIGVWIVLIIAIVFASRAFGGPLVNDFTIPNSDAQRASNLLQTHFPQQAGDSAQVIFSAPAGLASPSVKTAVLAALHSTTRIPGVTGTGNPYTGLGGAISRSGTIAYANVQFRQQAFKIPVARVNRMERLINRAVAGHGIQVAYSGNVI